MFKTKKLIVLAFVFLAISVLFTATIAYAKTVKVTGVSLDKSKLTINVGKTYKLKATVKPTNATKKSVTWKSSSVKTATVTSSGVVKGIKTGSATVTVTTVDGKKSAKCTVTVKPAPTPTPAPVWKLVNEENFTAPITQPPAWTQDTYGPTSKYHVDYIDEDGSYFVGRMGASFTTKLNSFNSFRKSFSYGNNGWLTVEEYGRDSDKNGTPESGGAITNNPAGGATLSSAESNDGVIIRSTKTLPSRYKIEVTLSNINFGGEKNGSWSSDGRLNGYLGTENGSPWDGSAAPLGENGMHFLGISDALPAPHDNIFWYTHRKVYMETDNNGNGTANPFTTVWDPTAGKAVFNGNHPILMLFSDGNAINSIASPLPAMAYSNNGFSSGNQAVDCYLEGETYTFSIERTNTSYIMSVSGKFQYGGTTTYTATRPFNDSEHPIWHYNQTGKEYPNGIYNKSVSFTGQTIDSWPGGSSYPEYFYLGDPHTNFYLGSVDVKSIKMWAFA